MGQPDRQGIELSKELYEAACNRFKHVENIRLLQGDSGKVLPELLNRISEPALFWLDGHYSGGTTARGDAITPISVELQSIFSHRIKRHVILIDDARLFNGTNGYPDIADLLREIRQGSNHKVEISADIIRLTPRAS